MIISGNTFSSIVYNFFPIIFSYFLHLNICVIYCATLAQKRAKKIHSIEILNISVAYKKCYRNRNEINQYSCECKRFSAYTIYLIHLLYNHKKSKRNFIKYSLLHFNYRLYTLHIWIICVVWPPQCIILLTARLQQLHNDF